MSLRDWCRSVSVVIVILPVMMVVLAAPVAIQAAGADQVVIEGNEGNDDVLIVVNGTKEDGTCAKDHKEPVTSDTTIDLGLNLNDESDCEGPILVASKDDGLMISTQAEMGFTPDDDVITVQLDSPLIVPLKVFLVTESSKIDDLAERAHNDVLRAQIAFRDNWSGIAPVADSDVDGNLAFEAVTATATVNAMRAAVKHANPTCEALFQTFSDAMGASHVEEVLNVYYVDIPPVNGYFCSPLPATEPQKRQLVLVHTGSSNTTLTHEIGHALGLDHLKHPYDWSVNLMSDLGYKKRNRFWIGESFRMNAFEESFLLSDMGNEVVDIACNGQDANDSDCPGMDLDHEAPRPFYN